ncbi:MAG: carboxypeptidase regulatory-like domain-containing protein, partial [Candidatus Nanohalobium sp.]
KWFFGDSSSPAYGKTVKHSYSSTGSYDVQLVVKDSKGNTDSLTRTVPVRQKPGACSVQVSSLNLAESIITRGESTEASVTVSNLGEKQVFNVKFMSSGNVVKNKEVAIGANSQRTFSKAFSPTVDTIVTAKVSTQSGEGPCPFKEWTRFQELVVVGSEEEPSSLEVKVRSSEGKRLYNARVAVDKPSGGTNVRYTGASGRAVFDLSEGTFDVTVSKSGYGSEFRTVTLAEGQNKEITVTLDESEDSQGSLIALVEDGEGNRLENAEVTVLDGAQKTESTDSNGRAVINLDSGTYTVKAEKSGYGTRIKTVEIDQGEDTTEVFHLTDEKGLVITDIQYPSSVCRGATMKAQVTIENRGGLHQFISLTGSGLGSINAVSSFSLESGSQVTKTLYFTNVQGTGSEEFTVTVSNHDSDKAERTVQVNSCPVPTTDKPSDISLTVSYTRKPQMAVAGDIIKVDGFVDGVSGRSTVDI